MSFALTGWWARWPEDGETLVQALAIAAAFRTEFTGRLEIAILGDMAAAGAGVPAALSQAGVADSELPEVVLGGAEDPAPLGHHISAFAERFALADERRLRTAAPVFSVGLRGDHAIADAACVALSEYPDAARAVMIGDGLDGIGDVSARVPVTVVALSPLTRRVAHALTLSHPVSAISRPPHPVRMPVGDVVALDGRRAADIRLAAGAEGAVLAIAHGGRLTPECLAAYGVDWIAKQDDVVLCGVSGLRTELELASSDRALGR
jgi:hypothetical protein